MIEGQFSSRMRTTVKSANDGIDMNTNSASKYGTLAEKKELRASSLINNTKISQDDDNIRRKSVRFSVQLEQFHKNTSSVIQQGILKKKKNSNDKIEDNCINNKNKFNSDINSKNSNLHSNSTTNSNTNINSSISYVESKNNNNNNNNNIDNRYNARTGLINNNNSSSSNNKRASLSEQLSAIGNKAQDITNEIRENAGMPSLKSYGNGGNRGDHSNSKLLFTLPAKSLAVGTLVCKYPSPVHFYEGFCEYNFQHPHEPVEITMTMHYRDIEQPMVTSINNGPNGGTYRLKFKVPRHLNQFLHDYEPNNRMHSIIIELTTQSSAEQIKQEVLPRMLGINMANITSNNKIKNNNNNNNNNTLTTNNLTLNTQNDFHNRGGILNNSNNNSNNCYRTPSESMLSLQYSTQNDTATANAFHSRKAYSNNMNNNNNSTHARRIGSSHSNNNSFRSLKNQLPKFKSATQKLDESLASLNSIGDSIGGGNKNLGDFLSSNNNFNSRNNSNSLSIRNRSSSYSNSNFNSTGRLGTGVGSNRRNNMQHSYTMSAANTNNISYAQNKPRPSTVGEASPSLYPGRLKDLNFRSSGMRSLASSRNR